MSLGLRYGARLPRTATRWVVAALTAILVVGPFAFSGQAQAPGACSVPDQVTDLGGDWQSIKAPGFPAGPPTILDYDVSPVNPSIVYVHNGVVVMRSFDGGCHFGTALSLAELPSGNYPFTSSDSRVTEVTVLSSGFVNVGIAQGETVPHILLSKDGGDTWQLGTGLQNQPGRPVQITHAPVAPGYVYALLDVGVTSNGVEAELSDSVARSDDGGETWESWASFQGGGDITLPVIGKVEAFDQGIDGIAVTNTNPVDVWLYGGGQVYRFNPATGEFEPIPVAKVPPPIGYLDSAAAGGPSEVYAAAEQTPTTYVSLDGGENFQEVAMPGVVSSIATGRVPWQRFISTDVGMYELINGQPFDVSPPGRFPLTSLKTSYSGNVGRLYGLTPTHLFRLVTDIVRPGQEKLPFVAAEVCQEKVCKAIEQELGSLLPANKKIVMPRGRTTTVPYTLSLDAAPTPLDVFFLIDVSGSMQEEINGIRESMGDIATGLGQAGIDVQFGVGEYRSFSDDPAYNKLLDIHPPGQQLEDALNELEARGGGDETQLEALYQVATGEGHKGSGWIDPGQDATWRPGTVRVIVHVTDEPFSDRENDGPQHRPYGDVIAALNNVAGGSVYQIGLAIQDIAQTTTGQLGVERVPYEGLFTIAEGTSTLAPAQGVDCNGDGVDEIDPGDPIVCIIDPDRSREASVMTPAIVNTLKAVKDVGSVDLRVRDASQGVVIKDIRPRLHYPIDFKQQVAVDFKVTYACPPLKETRSFPVDLVATDEGRPLARAQALVRCMVEEEEEPSQVPPFLQLPPVVPPLARPPQPAPEPNPNPQQQPASQPASQTQGAFAAQEQEQPQLAFATSGFLDEEIAAEKVEEYQMSRYRTKPQESGAELLYMAGALSMAFGFGCAELSRQRVRTAKARR